MHTYTHTHIAHAREYLVLTRNLCQYSEITNASDLCLAMDRYAHFDLQICKRVCVCVRVYVCLCVCI